MEAAGCENMAVGIESGSERVQKLIQKKVTVEKIGEQAAMIEGCTKIKIRGYFMIDFLDETEEEIWETIQLARELPLVSANFYLVIPIPGTAIFDEAMREGRLQLDRINWDTCTSDQIAFRRNHVSGERLIQLRRQAYLRFYGRPSILWDVLKTATTNTEVMRAIFKKVRMLSRRSETVHHIPLYLRESES
jgi:anaerobic magnesium-protoporphyrin IX monomethyl ester cyclase